jgi:hypothetical protein
VNVNITIGIVPEALPPQMQLTADPQLYDLGCIVLERHGFAFGENDDGHICISRSSRTQILFTFRNLKYVSPSAIKVCG